MFCQQGVIIIKYLLVASNLFSLSVSAMNITCYWHTILIPKHFTVVSPNGYWCLLGLTKKPHFKIFSLQNSQCWYLNDPGSTIYLVAWSCFSKLVQNFERRSNWKIQWQSLNKDMPIEVGRFERKITYRNWNNSTNWVPKMDVITMTDSFEMQFKHNKNELEDIDT